MRKFLQAVASLFLICSVAFAMDDSRTKNRVGVLLSGNGAPAPSPAGLELAINATSFLRFDAGFGAYTTEGPNLLRGAGNLTIRPILYAFAWLFDAIGQFMSKGKVPTHLKWSEYRYQYLDSRKSLFTYGGGLKLFVPGWSLSPTVGANWAAYNVSGSPYGIGTSGTHIYYSGGLDFQSEGGFHLGVGYNYCPGLPKIACGVYGTIGYF
ncbi:MAG: hypothetical protein AB7F43_04375 [Bacteriovoracia bacterium]